jgi:MoxR-like ATPase
MACFREITSMTKGDLFEMTTKSQEIAADITALLRARNPLIWVVSREEARVEGYLFQAAAAAGYIGYSWDCAAGVCDISGKPQRNLGSADIGDTLSLISNRSTTTTNPERNLWIMRDLPPWISGTIGITTVRQLRNLARSLPGVPRTTAQAIVILSPNSEVPAELSGHATVIDWPLPDRAEITTILDVAIDSLPDDIKKDAAPNGVREEAIDAAVGLSGEEAQACYARSLVQLRRIDPGVVSREKKRVIARERVLEWFDPIPGGLEAVGGLDVLKSWLVSRKLAYSADAREYGLPAPKGALLVGISGCGKSLTAKAIATAWNVPLLRVDLGALKSKFVGESEQNLRKAFGVIEAIGRCVVWVDEIEKALAGATQGAADGGVSSDALGAILSWMQERQGSAFVIATANDISSLPPELLRKGRFDEIWWVDLPNEKERRDILAAALRAHGRDGKELHITTLPEVAEIVAATEGFTGSEIAALIPDALFAAFADDKREIETDDILDAAKTVVPLSKTMAEKIEKMRAWAEGRARKATSALKPAEGRMAVRRLDL